MGAGLGLANATKDLDDDKGEGNDERIDSSNKIISIPTASMTLVRDEKKNTDENEENSLASPGEIESHESTELRRHENLNNNNVQTEDPEHNQNNSIHT